MHRRVNKYPIQRAFTAIGSGGSEFKASMIKAVEQVTGPVHVECISERPSSKGSYISVTVRVWGAWGKCGDKQAVRNPQQWKFVGGARTLAASHGLLGPFVAYE